MKSCDATGDAILKSAMAEFKKGYRNSFLRDIACNAGTTTGSIYTRYKSKEKLFNALVGETADGLKDIMQVCLNHMRGIKKYEGEQLYGPYYREVIPMIADYINNWREETKLLADCAEGTFYEGYVCKLADIEPENSDLLWPDKLIYRQLTDDVICLLTRTFYKTFFDFILHDKLYVENEMIERLIQLHISGWDTALLKIKQFPVT